MKRPRILYTKRATPFVLECMGYERNGEFITKNGEYVIKNEQKVKLKEVIGFSKDIGIITSVFEL